MLMGGKCLDRGLICIEGVMAACEQTNRNRTDDCPVLVSVSKTSEHKESWKWNIYTILPNRTLAAC
jgi:hypothetical protein